MQFIVCLTFYNYVRGVACTFTHARLTYGSYFDGNFPCLCLFEGTTEITTECTSASVIGNNTGVYVGGLPQDFVIHRQDSDNRLKVCTTFSDSLQGSAAAQTVLGGRSMYVALLQISHGVFH